ncbi:MAG: hypothetical protein KY462_04695 [Actinobacteria bacterium]|nr:hypothetical protein [Actinomycetota bacterium]
MVPGPATTAAATQDPDGSMLVVTDVRVSGHDAFDRLVFEIAGQGDVGWRIEYDDDPRSQGSGDPVSIEGDAVLRIALTHIAYPGDAPAQPRQGPERLRPTDTDVVVEILDDVLFEGRQEFFVGLRDVRPYRVARLDDPQRLVIDIETR